MMDSPAEPQSEAHPSDANGGVQRSPSLVQIEGEIGGGPHQCGRLRQLPASPSKMSYLGIASNGHAPAGLTDLYAVIKVVASPEFPPGEGIGNLPPHHQACS